MYYAGLCPRRRSPWPCRTAPTGGARTCFQAGGLGLVLWSRDKLAEDCGLEPGPAVGFDGIALAHNVRSETEVDELLAAAERAGGTITKPAATNAIGFYSSAFVDPDGHAWEIAYNPAFPLAEDGTVTLPDFNALLTTLHRPASTDRASGCPEAQGRRESEDVRDREWRTAHRVRNPSVAKRRPSAPEYPDHKPA